MAGQADGRKAKPSNPNGAFFRKAPLLRKLCGKLPPLSVGGGGKLFAKASLLRKRSTLVRAKRSAEMRTQPKAQPRTPEAPTCKPVQSAPRSYYHCDHTKLRGDAAVRRAEVRLGGVAETFRERRYFVKEVVKKQAAEIERLIARVAQLEKAVKEAGIMVEDIVKIVKDAG